METVNSIHPKYIKGIKGWLLFFLLSLLFIGVNMIIIVIKYFSNPRLDFFNLRLEFLIIHLTLIIAGIFFPFFVIYQMFKKKIQSLFIAKIFLILLPFYSFAWSMFLSTTMPFELESSIITGLFTVGILYSTPWLLYLNYSRRVNNTYLFTGKYLPSIVQCPFCLDKLQLDKEEREAQELICPTCNNIISAKILG
jgi:hypothetical protein